jgi:Pup amidohydrolase
MTPMVNTQEIDIGAGASAPAVPKYIGFEIELGNHRVEAAGEESAFEPAGALVEAHHRLFPGQMDEGDGAAGEFDSCGFRFYLDHKHAEISSPLASSAADLVLHMRQARKIVAACKQAAEAETGPLRVSFNNTNRHGCRWGCHGSVLVSRPAFNLWQEEDWELRLSPWVTFVVISILLSGTGKVGGECGARDIDFQLSQQADFIGGTVGLDTVASKTIINTRDEPLADPARYARFHITAWDTNLMEFATWLKFGIAQLLPALIEEGLDLPDLTLADPVRAVRTVSRDLKMKKRLRLRNGRRETALELHRRLAEAVARAIAKGCAASQVPDAELIVGHWLETLDDLETGHPRLSRRLDWCAKRDLLRRAQKLGTKDRPRQLLLDLHYAEVGGLFEKLEKAGAVDHLEDFIPPAVLAARASESVPREQARATLVRRFGRHLVHVDWDYAIGQDEAHRLWFIPMDDPLDGRELLEAVVRAQDWAACLSRLIDMELAQTAAICALVCEDRPDDSGRPAEMVLN